MNENQPLTTKPSLWIIDSERAPLKDVAADLADDLACVYFPDPQDADFDENPPDLLLVSAEIRGGANGQTFAQLIDTAQDIPVIIVAMLRSLAQAVAFFRAGASDYLSLPLERDELLERFAAALDRAEKLAMRGLVMQLEPLDQELGDITLSITPTEATSSQAAPITVSVINNETDHKEETDEDILAHLPGQDRIRPETIAPEKTEPQSHALPATTAAAQTEKNPPSETSSSASHDPEEADEPEAVDGLPIPTLWEELPCGLLVFDSVGNMVFANRMGLELFGYESVAELQEVLENQRQRFAPHAANLRPLPDNQWPQVLAQKSRMARSAVLSIEKPDRRRAWIRIDCLPHLHDGKITRLSMTIVNLTGELPPFQPRPEPPPPPSVKKDKRGRKKR